MLQGRRAGACGDAPAGGVMTDLSLAAPAWVSADDAIDDIPSSPPSIAPHSADLLLYLESNAGCVILCAAHGRIPPLNRHTIDRYSLDADTVAGRRLWDVFPRLIGTLFEHEYRQAMTSRRAGAFQG